MARDEEGDAAARRRAVPDAPGVIAAIVTPYNGYGGIDTDGVGQLVERAMAGGAAGVLVNGPIGEAAHLSRGERLFVIEAATEAAAGRVPLWAGTGAASQDETLALTWDAGKAGVAAAAVVAPSYFRLSQRALLAHYREIARRGRLPIVALDAPTALGNGLEPATLGEIARLPGIAAIVYAAVGGAASGAAALAEAIRLVGDAVPVLGGDDHAGDDPLAAGAHGLVSALAGVLPADMAALLAAQVAGEHERAAARWSRLAPLAALLTEQGEAVAACKAALDALGLPGGEPRRPLPGLDEAGRARVRAALARAEGDGG